MNTKIIKVNDPTCDCPALREAADILRRGGLVVFPTETVYGLGGDATSADSSRKIYEAKGRPSDNPLIIHIAHPDDAEQYAITCPCYHRLAKAFMPGPLTVILPRRDVIPRETTGGLDTVAVRCPSHPTARALIRAAGVPLAAPSANRSGCPSPTTAEHVLRDMDGRIEMILDGGPAEIGLESTVISLTDGGCVILRPGAVTETMLAEVCGTVTVTRAVTDPEMAGDKPLSPGMKYKHYAPEAEVILVDASEENFFVFVRENIQTGEAVAAADDTAPRFAGMQILSTGRVTSAAEESRSLFALLRKADDLASNAFI